MKKKCILGHHIYQFTSIGLIIVLSACFLFLWFGLSSSLMALRESHALASSLLVILCFLIINRVVALIIFQSKSEKKLMIHDQIGICVFLLLIISGTVYNLFRPSIPKKGTESYYYFDSCLRDETFAETNPLSFDSLLEPESWELLSWYQTQHNASTTIRLTYVNCLTEYIAQKYQRQFKKDYSNAEIQTSEIESYTLITAEGESRYEGEETGLYVMSSITRKGKYVVILQITGAHDDIAKTFHSLMQSILTAQCPVLCAGPKSSDFR